MEIIKTYIENVFAAFPDTEQTHKLKGEMLTGLEEKYRELKKQGKSENEAIGTVIASFGSADEIAVELGIEKISHPVDDKRDEAYFSAEQVGEYLDDTRRYSKFIGGGVWIIMVGVAALIAHSHFADNNLGVLFLIASVSIAVPLFIISGSRLEKYEEFEYFPIRIDQTILAEIEQLRQIQSRKGVVKIAVGVVLIILAVGALVANTLLIDQAVLGVLIILVTTGFSVFLFVTAGMMDEALDFLLNKGDYAEKILPDYAHQKGRKIGAISSIYWSVVTAVFLAWGFIWDGWGISWVVWPIAGVLFGGISGFFSEWPSRRK